MTFAPRWLVVAVLLAIVLGVALAVALYQAAAA